MPSTADVTPTTGPTVGLRLVDPTTQYLIASILAVIAAVIGMIQDPNTSTRLAAVLAVVHLTLIGGEIVKAKHLLQASVIRGLSVAASYAPQALSVLSPVLPREVTDDATAVLDTLTAPASEPFAPVNLLPPPNVTVDPPLGPPTTATPAPPEPAPAPPASAAAVVVNPAPPAPSTWAVTDANGVVVGHIDPADPTRSIIPSEGH